MELRQLVYLVAVVDEGGFTRAAERLHVAQPGVSAQVRRLERELGEPLLDRSGRRVRLTAAGEAVLPYARAALAAVDAAGAAVSEVTGLLRGRVAIGTVPTADVGLPDVLAAFHADHPAVETTLTEGDSDALADALRDGSLDLAVLALGTTPPDGLATHVVTTDAIVAAVARTDAWADRASVPLRELAARRLICLPRGSGNRSRLDAACAAAGLEPMVAFEAGNPVLLGDLAARGLGVAVLTRTYANARDDLAAIAITRPALTGRLAYAWREGRERNPAARELVARARQQ